jgi:hypothetical protein
MLTGGTPRGVLQDAVSRLSAAVSGTGDSRKEIKLCYVTVGQGLIQLGTDSKTNISPARENSEKPIVFGIARKLSRSGQARHATSMLLSMRRDS